MPNCPGFLRISLLIASLCATLAIFVSCAGGGSRGTGGFEYTGSLVSRTGTPLVEVQVTILQTGDSDITDENGVFQIFSDPPNGNTEFIFEREDFTATVTVAEVSRSAVALEVTFQVDEQSGAAETISINEVLGDINSTGEQFGSDSSDTSGSEPSVNSVGGGSNTAPGTTPAAGGGADTELPTQSSPGDETTSPDGSSPTEDEPSSGSTDGSPADTTPDPNVESDDNGNGNTDPGNGSNAGGNGNGNTDPGNGNNAGGNGNGNTDPGNGSNAGGNGNGNADPGNGNNAGGNGNGNANR